MKMFEKKENGNIPSPSSAAKKGSSFRRRGSANTAEKKTTKTCNDVTISTAPSPAKACPPAPSSAARKPGDAQQENRRKVEQKKGKISSYLAQAKLQGANSDAADGTVRGLGSKKTLDRRAAPVRCQNQATRQNEPSKCSNSESPASMGRKSAGCLEKKKKRIEGEAIVGGGGGKSQESASRSSNPQEMKPDESCTARSSQVAANTKCLDDESSKNLPSEDSGPTSRGSKVAAFLAKKKAEGKVAGVGGNTTASAEKSSPRSKGSEVAAFLAKKKAEGKVAGVGGNTTASAEKPSPNSRGPNPRGSNPRGPNPRGAKVAAFLANKKSEEKITGVGGATSASSGARVSKVARFLGKQKAATSAASHESSPTTAKGIERQQTTSTPPAPHRKSRVAALIEKQSSTPPLNNRSQRDKTSNDRQGGKSPGKIIALQKMLAGSTSNGAVPIPKRIRVRSKSAIKDDIGIGSIAVRNALNAKIAAGKSDASPVLERLREKNASAPSTPAQSPGMIIHTSSERARIPSGRRRTPRSSRRDLFRLLDSPLGRSLGSPRSEPVHSNSKQRPKSCKI